MKRLNLLSLLLMLACGSNGGGSGSDSAVVRKADWTDFKVSALVDACTESTYADKASENVTLEKTRTFCQCIIDELSAKFPYSDVEAFPDQAILKIRDTSGKSCADKNGLKWDEVKGISLE